MKRKKLLSLLLAMAMLFSLAVSANAEEAEEDLAGSIVILHTNDVHGAIEGYAKVAALKDAYEARGAYVLLMDAGDFIQGDPTVSVSEGATAVELMNLAGYDVAAPGNHEFDYGYQNLKALEEAAEFPIVAANVFYDGKTAAGGRAGTAKTLAFEEHVIFTSPEGVKIGVFGLSTPETATKAHPAKIQGVTFQAGEELFRTARAVVQMLEDAGCDYIVCLGHLGIDEASAGNRSIDLLEHVDGIDVFIDGHSHSTRKDLLDATDGAGAVGGTLVTSTGTKMESVGVVTITGGLITAYAIPMEDLTDEDADVADRAAEIRAAIDADYGAVFAKNEVALDGEKEHVRAEETNLGNLIADALAWGAAEAGTQVDGAVTNGGGIRASIAPGDITKKDINTVLPFGNTLSIVEVTGAELLEALEASTYCTPETIGGFPQVSSIEFTVDTAKAYDQGELYPGSTYYAPKTINRVSIQTVGGEAFDPEAVYTIATNDFLAAGGDTYYAFASASVNYDLGLAMDEVVMDYITDYLGGTVTYEAYSHTGGRITVESALPFTDVSGDDPYYDDVKFCYDNDIFKGVTDTLFSPAGTMTRGQMVTVLWRMNGSPEPSGALPFGDVAADSPFAKAIAWGYEQQLVNGYTETEFKPGQAISTQQFLAILYRYGQMMDYDMSGGITLEMYADQDTISDYARDAMEWAVGSGVLVADKVLRPTGAAMRFEVAGYLAAFCQTTAAAA